MNIEETIDYEAHRLKRLIDNKKTFLAKLEPSTMQYKHLLSEIEFLEQDILPMILGKNLWVNEFNKFVNQKINELANHPDAAKVNGLLLYIHFNDPNKNLIEIGHALTAFASTDKRFKNPLSLIPIIDL